MKSLWSKRNNPTLRGIYFRLPLKFRVKVRNKFAKKVIYKKFEQNIPIHDFSRIPDVKISERHIVEVGRQPLCDWTFKSPNKTKSQYHFEKILSIEAIDLISFDVWDTLIGRYRPAEGVKRATALKMSIGDWIKRGYSTPRISTSTIYDLINNSEALQSELIGESSLDKTLDEVIRNLNLNVSQSEIFEYQIKDEIEGSYFIPESISALDLEAKRKVLVSDFHLESKDLARILELIDVSTIGFELETSRSNLETKRNEGALFRKLGFDHLNQWVHVGDNQISDWKNAQRLGAQVIKVKKMSTNSWHGHEVEQEKLCYDFSTYLDCNDSSSYLIDLASISYGLCTSAIELALEVGASKVVYISREGEVLSQAHLSLLKNLTKLGLREITPIHFPVSRSAIVMASWTNFEEIGLSQIAKQYPIMSTKALIETLGLPPELHYLILKNFSPFERFRTIDAWKRLDTPSRVEINKYLSVQRGLIAQLLLDLGINSFNSVICDLGWRGSIQNAIERILEAPLSGQYLGIFNPFDNQVHGLKQGLVFDETRGIKQPTYLGLLGPIERAFTISDRQVTGYTQNGANVVPILSLIPEKLNPDRIKLISDHFASTVSIVADSLLSVGIFGYESTDFVKYTLEKWFNHPSEFHASTWFDEEHAESFGAGGDVHYLNHYPDNSWITKSLRNVVRTNATDALWIEGYLEWLPIKSIIERCKIVN